MDDFYLVLASNASHEIYPKNRGYHFYNVLKRLLVLTGKWRVSLQEIIYRNSIQTIVDEKIRIITILSSQTNQKKIY